MTSTAFDRETVWHLLETTVGPQQWFCNTETKFYNYMYLSKLSRFVVDSVVHISDLTNEIEGRLFTELYIVVGGTIYSVMNGLGDRFLGETTL